MGLIGNQSVLHKSCATFRNGTATAGAYAANVRTNQLKPHISRSKSLLMGPFIAVPYGYNIGQAIFPSIKTGGIACHTLANGSSSTSPPLVMAKIATASLEGTSSISASLSQLIQLAAALSGEGLIPSANVAAVASLAAAITASGTIAANISALVPMAAALIGLASNSSNLTGVGRLEADLTPFTELSPESLAAALLNAALASYNEAGSVGEALNNVGASGNPWASDTSSNTSAGTFGELVQKLLTKGQFLGLK